MRLDSSEPPPDLPYEELDDWQARALLTANGIGETEDELLAALGANDANLRALAAHHLGALGAAAAVPALRRAAAEDDDLVQVEAAWSLARLGHEEGTRRLLELIGIPVDASVVPLKAAGYLARLGRPDGFAAARAGLESDNFLVRLTATKQLFFFAPRPDVDLAEAFRRALSDEEEDVRWAARYQLDDLDEESLHGL